MQSPDAPERAEIQNLGNFVMSGWRLAAFQRRQNGIDEELLECLRNCKGEYGFDEKAKIEATGQPLFYVQHADRKRRESNTLVGAIFLNSSDWPFVLRPTPVPEVSQEDAAAIAKQTIDDYVEWQTMQLIQQGVPPDQAQAMVAERPPDPLVVQQYARSRRDEIDNKRMEEATRKVSRMELKIRDQLLEGRWREAMTTLVNNCSQYGTGVLKLCRRNRMRGHFVGGEFKRTMTEVWECEAISPFDCYPSKGAVEIGHGDFYQRVRFLPKQLNDMRKMGRENGYFPDEIEAVLNVWPNGGLVLYEPIDAERKRLENDGTTSGYKNTQLEAIESWQDVRGSLLIDQGITETTDGAPIAADEYYEANIIVMDNRVIFCSLKDEVLGRPLFKGVFYRIEGSWWGESPVKKMRDPAKLSNAVYRAKAVNQAASSGPVIFYDTSKFLCGNKFTFTPYAAYGFNPKGGDSTPPVKVVQVANNTMEMNADLSQLEKLFDTLTGIPSASHVNDASATAGRTYNGLLLIITASKEGANTVVYSLYLDVMKPFLNYLYQANMMFIDDPDIKGDCEVDAGGLLSILVKEQSTNRLLELLTLAQQPGIRSVIGDTGMAEMLRQYVKLLQGINPDSVVPSQAEMEKRAAVAAIEAKMAQAQQQAQAMQQEQMAQTAQAAPSQAPARQRQQLQEL